MDLKYLILFLLTGLSLVRILPAQYGELIAYDPFYWERGCQYFTENGAFWQNDPLSVWGYPFTGKPFLCSFSSIFDSSHQAFLLYPVLIGALLVPMAYLLGRKLKNERTGLIFAVMQSVFPLAIAKTTAGWSEEDALGLFLSYGLLLAFAYYREKKEKKMTFSCPKESRNITFPYKFSHDPCYLALMLITGLSLYLTWSSAVYFYGVVALAFILEQKDPRRILAGLALASVLFLSTAYLFLPGGHNLMDFITGNESVLFKTIKEEGSSPEFIFSVFNIWFVFIPLGLAKSALEFKDRNTLPLILSTTSLYLIFAKLKYSLLFYTGSLLCFALGVDLVFELSEKYSPKKYSKEILYGLAFICLVITFSYAESSFSLAGSLTPHITPAQNTLAWIKNNTPEGSVILAWWDQGHWIAARAERKTVLDNLNLNQDRILKTADFFITGNTQILDESGADYIMINFDAVKAIRNMGLFLNRTIECGADQTTVQCSEPALIVGMYYAQAIEVGDYRISEVYRDGWNRVWSVSKIA